MVGSTVHFVRHSIGTLLGETLFSTKCPCKSRKSMEYGTENSSCVQEAVKSAYSNLAC